MDNKYKKKRQPKTVIVGLDGVPFSLLQDLKYRGKISNMNAIFDTGHFDQMSVCIPEISSVSWTSFMTGTQSGEHGIFGFIDLKPGSYNMFFPNFRNINSPTLWDELAFYDKKTVVINMPATYPAKKINGALISGFVAIDINKAVYPQSYIPILEEMNYRIDLDTAKARKDHDFLFQDLDATLESRQRAIDFMWEEIDWDLFIVVITGTDRLMHFLWDAYENEDHAYNKKFLDYFHKVDNVVGMLYEYFLAMEGSGEGENQFFMLSDHGFTKIKTEVYINTWLRENAYLKFNKDNPGTIMDIGPNSLAFAMDPSRIYINLKRKYPLGTVSNSDYESIRQEIKQGLEMLTYTDGNKIAKKVYLKEELYKGPYFEMAPDLVVLSNQGFDLKGRVNNYQIFERTGLEGMHTQDDAFFYSSGGFQCRTIFEAKKIILGSLITNNS